MIYLKKKWCIRSAPSPATCHVLYLTGTLIHRQHLLTELKVTICWALVYVIHPYPIMLTCICFLYNKTWVKWWPFLLISHSSMEPFLATYLCPQPFIIWWVLPGAPSRYLIFKVFPDQILLKDIGNYVNTASIMDLEQWYSNSLVSKSLSWARKSHDSPP